MTAVEIRIFNGVHVSKRGVFYTGVETGLFFFRNIKDLTFTESTVVKMNLDYQGGLVFLMAKFGLRLDIGIALFGISLGGEIGIGGTMFAGGFDFTATSPTSGEEILQGYGNTTANMGVIADTSVESAIRLGKNFRLIGKAGIIAAPISTENNKSEFFYNYSETYKPQGWYWSGDPGSTTPLSGDDEIRAVLNNYQVEMNPFAVDLRVGFILNYN